MYYSNLPCKDVDISSQIQTLPMDISGNPKIYTVNPVKQTIPELTA